jgi:hypothetical protein
MLKYIEQNTTFKNKYGDVDPIIINEHELKINDDFYFYYLLGMHDEVGFYWPPMDFRNDVFNEIYSALPDELHCDFVELTCDESISTVLGYIYNSNKFNHIINVPLKDSAKTYVTFGLILSETVVA